MTLVLETLGTALIGTGVLFLLAAAIGLWRLPDVLSRLHALTKADTLGLAFVAAGAACLSPTPAAVVALFLCVFLIAVSGVTVGHLIARSHPERRSAGDAE
ncbi:cation:proton antiporter [Mameliella sediminis]|uniref:cation:proton antiporter n=1 Tax=Mameliella sediminis TaxID=2836866 RepID=UPI001C475221|nr:monovalent cation/H(+) antiporter subunit G [Mameliella sediminis]MBY6114824.1 monovalent cation/H(+) antiporter subunit G [Antarctobacter heliothermus]MBY6144397.1 monovalent cation/H(+) antiporter subunit G [Mameliella alba]MBV7392695.1 monovalent cation/H(+) antiporter subunit G [Mameliella sediminis]MBY6163459.1 monovalent cation/H(+) antiporter subunit G [Mameliella alba]MBY6171722.1 monovalent cation/H(+) antiporter subunit G [Mameliella alba]